MCIILVREGQDAWTLADNISLLKRNRLLRRRDGDPRHQCRNDLQRRARRQQTMQESKVLRASDWDERP
jgi:hypothetical protein